MLSVREGQGRGDSLQGVPHAQEKRLLKYQQNALMPHGPRALGILAHAHI